MALGLSLSPTPLPPKGGFTSPSQSRTSSSNLFTPSSLLHSFPREVASQSSYPTIVSPVLKCTTTLTTSKKMITMIPRCSGSSPSGSPDDSDKPPKAKVPFGYSRKDVLLIGVGVTVLGIGLKSGLEYAGVDPLQAGNVVQLVLVLGLTIGWISTYIFRVSNKEMTYAQQLRDYESKVMEKRIEGLTEAELEVLLQQVEEEKQSLSSGKKKRIEGLTEAELQVLLQQVEEEKQSLASGKKVN